MAVTVSARSPRPSLSTPGLIKVAATCAALGIALSITEYGDYGQWLTILGVVSMIAGLHRWGRSGPDEAIRFELATKPRKRKKKQRPAAESAVSDDATPEAPGNEE